MAGDDKVRNFRLPVNTGIRPDGFAEDVPILDMNNFVLKPDGSALMPRGGLEIRRNDAIGYGSGRKLISFMSNPPDIDYGDMIVVTNTKNGRAFVEQTEVVRTTNTVSLENPMGMPSLPDYVPPALHPILGAFVGAGEFYDTSVVFYDTGAEAFVGPATLTSGLYVSDDASLFRTENYICTCEGSLSGSGNAVINAYDIRTITTSGANEPAQQVIVYADTGLTTSNKQVYAYAGDIVFIIDDVGAGAYSSEGPHDFRLYKVDLATGGVTDTAITGLPNITGFGSGPYFGSCAVDGNGDLWANGFGGDFSGQTVAIKINPATSACTAYKVVTSSGGSVETGCFAQASSDQMIFVSGFNQLSTVDNALTTTSVLPNADNISVGDTSSIANSLLGDVGIAPLYGVGDVCVYNFATGVKIGTAVPKTDYDQSYFPGWCVSGSAFGALVTRTDDDGSVWVLNFINSGTGAVTRAVDGPEVNSSYMTFIDAFAYGIQHIQGSRL